MQLSILSRAVWGVALLAAPRALLRTLRTPPDPPNVAIARVLGVRHLAQSLVTAFRPSPTVRTLGMAVDGTHALTAVVTSARDRDRRVPALIETGLAIAWIATASAAGRRCDPRRDRARAPGGRTP